MFILWFGKQISQFYYNFLQNIFQFVAYMFPLYSLLFVFFSAKALEVSVNSSADNLSNGSLSQLSLKSFFLTNIDQNNQIEVNLLKDLIFQSENLFEYSDQNNTIMYSIFLRVFLFLILSFQSNSQTLGDNSVFIFEAATGFNFIGNIIIFNQITFVFNTTTFLQNLFTIELGSLTIKVLFFFF